MTLGKCPLENIWRFLSTTKAPLAEPVAVSIAFNLNIFTFLDAVILQPELNMTASPFTPYTLEKNYPSTICFMRITCRSNTITCAG
jgi:hypothetical protein